MDLCAFESATLGVVRSDGFDAYLPTVVLLDIQELRVLDGIPETVEQTTPLQETIESHGWTKGPFLFAVRSGSNEITLGSCIAGACTFRSILRVGGEFLARPSERPGWWRL